MRRGDAASRWRPGGVLWHEDGPNRVEPGRPITAPEKGLRRLISETSTMNSRVAPLAITAVGLTLVCGTTGCQRFWQRRAAARAAQTAPQTQPQAFTAAAPRSAPPSSNGGQNTPFFDPFAISTSGVQANRPVDISSSVTTASAPQAPRGPQAPSSAVNLSGQVIASQMSNRTPIIPPAGGGNLTQVSFSQEGADFDPDVSRDGKHIVFASTQHRTSSDIFIKNVDSRVVTQLTNDPGNSVMPRISPDGTRIAFSSNRSGNWNIYVMPLTGGKSVQVTTGSADDLHPSWSPDGTQIVFCRLGEVSGQWEMWVTDVGNSGVAKFIGYGLFPEWCPASGSGSNGADRIAFQRSRERGDRAFGIWTIDYKDGQAMNVTEIAASQAAACINASWSPDGQWLAFATVPNPTQWAASSSGRPSSADLWMVDINGNTRIGLTTGRAVNLMPTWGPGNRLFFVSDRGGVDNIWAMDTTSVVELAMANMRGNSALAHGATNTENHSPTAAAMGSKSAPAMRGNPSEHPATPEHVTAPEPSAEPPMATVPGSGEGNEPH